MELKERKRINNLPKYEDGKTAAAPASKSSALSAVPWASIAQFAMSGIGSGLSEMKSSNDMLMDAGTSQGSMNGISYQKVGDVDPNQIMRDYDKETRRSIATNPIKALTMAAGRRRQRRRAERAARLAGDINADNRASAASDYLEMQYSQQYGNQEDQTLYAKNGKDEGVYSALGEIPLLPNSKTEDGEIIYNRFNRSAKIIPGNNKGDKNLSFVMPSDTVISNKFGLSSVAEAAAKALQSINRTKKNRGVLGRQTDNLIKSQSTQVLDEVAEEQKQLRNMGLLSNPKLKKYAPGKDGDGFYAAPQNFPQFDVPKINFVAPKDPGLAKIDIKSSNKLPVVKQPSKRDVRRDKLSSNWWIDGAGILLNAGKYISDSLQKTKHSNSYRSNPLQGTALNTLASLRIDPQPIIREAQAEKNRGMYGINRAGGLSGAQKYFSNLALSLGTQHNIANSLANIQDQNNKYRSSFATTAANIGQAERQARMGANQYDLDYYSKSHAARRAMLQQDSRDMLSALQQGYKNWNTNKLYNNIMSYYTA